MSTKIKTMSVRHQDYLNSAAYSKIHNYLY